MSQFPFPAEVPWSYPPDAIRIMGKNKKKSLVLFATVILNLTDFSPFFLDINFFLVHRNSVLMYLSLLRLS